MGMSFDEALETIKGERWIACSEKYHEAMDLITNTIHKYQKIDQILIKWHNNMDVNTSMAMTEIEEVMEDGNDDTTNTGSN